MNTTARFLLLGDATVIVPKEFDFEPVAGVTPVYPEVVPPQSGTIPEEKVQRLLALADDLGLVDAQIDYGHPEQGGLAFTDVTLTIHGELSAISGRLGPQRRSHYATQ